MCGCPSGATTLCQPLKSLLVVEPRMLWVLGPCVPLPRPLPDPLTVQSEPL